MPAQFSEAARKKLDAVIARYPNTMAATPAGAPPRAGASSARSPTRCSRRSPTTSSCRSRTSTASSTFYTMFHREPGGQEHAHDVHQHLVHAARRLRRARRVREASSASSRARPPPTAVHARRGGVPRRVRERAVRDRRHEVLPRPHARRRSTRSSPSSSRTPHPEVGGRVMPADRSAPSSSPRASATTTRGRSPATRRRGGYAGAAQGARDAPRGHHRRGQDVEPARPRRRRLRDRREVGLRPQGRQDRLPRRATPTSPSPAPARTASSSTGIRTCSSRA